MEVKSKGITSTKSSEDDFMEATGSILSGAIGSIPVVGSMLSGIFGAFWPGPKYLTVEDFQKEIKKLKEEMIKMMDSKIDAALDTVFNAIIDTQVLALINSGNNFSDAVNLLAESLGKKVTNIPKKRSKFAMEIQDLDIEKKKEVCRTQYQIFTDKAEDCIIKLSDDRFNEYSLSSLTFTMAHYVSSQLECIANGVEWGFPESYIEGNGGSVVGVKTKLHERIKRFHTDFGKGYNKTLKKGIPPGHGSLWRIVAAAGLINYSDKRLYQYPVEIKDSGYGESFAMEEFQRTYVPYTHYYRNNDKTVDDQILDHVTHQYQIRPLYNQYQSEIVFNYKFTTPPCKKFMVNFHLATIYSCEYEIYCHVLGGYGFASTFSTNSLTNNCPTMEVIRQSLEAGGQIPSDTKYGIRPLTYSFQSTHTSWELEIRCRYITGSQTDALYFEDINFTLLE